MNKVIVRGHIGADVELKHTTTNGISVCNIRVATNRKWKNAAGQLVEDTQWHNVVCWKKTAETTAQFMSKGSQVLVEGRLQTREFMGPATYENGTPVVDGVGNPILVKRYTTEIVADPGGVTFLDKKPAATAYAPVYAAAPVAGAPVVGAPVVGAPVVGVPVVAAAAPGAPFVMDGQPVGTTVVQPPPAGGAAAVEATFVQPSTAGVVPGV
jgi:single-strand DNA-binding protein